MSRNEAITINRGELADALQEWEAEADANDWPQRTDSARHTDNADYLFDKMIANKGSK